MTARMAERIVAMMGLSLAMGVGGAQGVPAAQTPGAPVQTPTGPSTSMTPPVVSPSNGRTNTLTHGTSPVAGVAGPGGVSGAPVQTPELATPDVKADGDKGSVGEIPIDTPGATDPKDVSAVGSPVPAPPRAVWIPQGAGLSLRLNRAVSSDSDKNGAMVDGVLLAPVKLSNGTMLAKGTPVRATVLAVAAAGQIASAGALSLQVVRVGNVAVTTNVVEFDGQRGKTEVADANPEKGTEAMVQAGASLQFKVLGAGDAWDSDRRTGNGKIAGRAGKL
ncbi:hypothetical protein [Granulicella tundricola]|uniref:Flp pilus assembly protein CpaB n=1 Tax=Granulicella tundricola (strain ATCC BAA-1859 / DSM 23138 / MP5ACTX9) TaxID=1198114 RepID=E8WW01_GRATM|nr:hypothetical protein [Granulicella tundricola]ADW67307.1 hypothetical protein AciX9_0233 [Granulicella tundricola MP5ACTX9]